MTFNLGYLNSWYPVTIATYITFFRLLIGPLFFALYVEPSFFGLDARSLPFVLIGVLAVSELSDAADGYLARRFNQVTDLGKLLDPMVDSVSRTSIFLTFTQEPVRLPLAFIFIFFYRDSLIGTLRTICALRGFVLAARNSGKIKAVIQALSALSILILMSVTAHGSLSEETLHLAAIAIVSLAALYTLYSAIDYIQTNRYYIAKLLRVT